MSKKINPCGHPRRWAAFGTRYVDGGYQLQCGAYEGSPSDLCRRQVYVCRHGTIVDPSLTRVAVGCGCVTP